MKKHRVRLLLGCVLLVMLSPFSARAAKEFDVDGITKSIENDPGFVNDYDPRVIYTGPWSKNSLTPAGGVASNGGRDWTAHYAGGGRAYLAEISGATVDFTFIGTSITVLMTRYPDLGSVEIKLDGQAPVKVDLTCELSQADDNYAAFKKTGLSDGVHTIQVKSVDAPGKNGKPPAPGYIHLVGFVTDNGIVNSSNTEYAKSGGFDLKTDSEANQTAACCIGDDLHVSTKKGGTMTFSFEGSYVAVLSKVGSGYGRAEVEIDGTKAGTIDLNESKTAIQRMVFSKNGLSSGKHTLKLTTLDDKTFTVDAFIVKQSAATASSTTKPPVASLVTTAATTAKAGTTTAPRRTDSASPGSTAAPESTGEAASAQSTAGTDETEAAVTGTGTGAHTEDTETGAGNSGGNPAVWIVVVIMIVLLMAVGGVAFYLLYLKPKMAAKHDEP